MTRETSTPRTGLTLFFMRKSNICLAFFSLCVLLLALCFAHAAFRQRSDLPAISRMAQTVADLELTDLCLFTEARYARHLSQADLHSPFQDHPVSLEHFLAGSIAGPPAYLRRSYGKLD